MTREIAKKRKTMDQDKFKAAIQEIAAHEQLITAFENNMIELYHQMNILELVFENLKRSLLPITGVHKKVRKITKE